MYYLLGIDAGTTSFKGMLMDEQGNIVCNVSESYALLSPAISIIEFQTENYWDIFKKVIAKILKQSKVDPGYISALTIDSQGETLICLDEHGNPTRNAIVWMDNRSVKEAEKIRDTFGSTVVYGITGQPEVVATWPATKIMWIRDNQPNIFKNTRKFLMLEDYLIYKLTGEYVTEKSVTSSTIYLDINKGIWWNDMLDVIGINSEQLPHIKESGVPVGALSEEACISTGLSRNTIVVTGALDQIAGVIGSGNIYNGMVSETTGSCLAMCINTGTIPNLENGYKIPIHCHALQGKYCMMFWSQTAGILLNWFKDNFYEGLHNSNDIYGKMDFEADNVPAGCEGLLLLPHFEGTAFPHFNPHAKGVFYGLTLKHTRAHFVRAIMESIGFMLREQLDAAEKLGISTYEIRSSGGGAKSRLWNEIKADVTGKPIVTLKNTETACLGSAILAGVGIGLYESIEKACSKTVTELERYNPDICKASNYKKSYDMYRNLYSNLSVLF